MDTNARQVIRVCVVGLFLATPMQARLAVYPMQISCAARPGEAVKTVVNLQNINRTAACHAVLRVVDLAQSEDGQWLPVDPNSPDFGSRPDRLNRASCRTWIALTRGRTQVLDIGPGRTESVDVHVLVPQWARGFSCAAILVQYNPNPTATGVVMEYEYVVPVLVEVEGRPPARNTRIADARLEPEDGGQARATRVCLVVENEGSAFSRLTGSAKVSLLQENRRQVVVPKIEFNEVGIIPGSRLVLKARLPQSLSPGSYRVTGMVTVDQRTVKRIGMDVEYAGDRGTHATGGEIGDSALSSVIQAGLGSSRLGPSGASTGPVAAVVDDGKTLRVLQAMASPDPSHTYTGSKTAEVHTNLPARLVVSAAAAGPAGGDWTARVTQTSRSDGTQIMISLTGENVRVDRLRQDARNVQVARVTLRIVPSL